MHSYPDLELRWFMQHSLGEELLLVDDIEQARHSLSPHLVLPLAQALELDDTVLRGPQAKVAALLAALEQMSARPCLDLLADFYNYICN